MGRHESYRAPEEAKSPRDRVEIHRILLDAGEGDVSIARGLWDGQPTLLMRWNGSVEQPYGFPSRFEHMTWMVVPRWMEKAILQALAEKISDDLRVGTLDIPAGGEKK